MKKILVSMFALILLTNLASAVFVSISESTLEPGQEGSIRIEIENIHDSDIKDVSLSLDFRGLDLIPVGSSEQTVDEIDEDDEEDYTFRIKASPEIKPGDYEIPYIVRYKLDGEIEEKSGTLGVRVRADPILVYILNAPNAVKNQQGEIELKIVNKGFFDARFVSVRVLQQGFTTLSDKEIYLGTVDSDDFETATFDVRFDDLNPVFIAVVEYKNFDNKIVTEHINLPLKVYTRQEAIELGIVKQSNAPIIIALAVTLILAWILYRTIKKRKRLVKSKDTSRRK